MKHTSYRYKRTVSIRTVLLAFSVFFVLAVIFPAGYFLLNNAIAESEAHAHDALEWEASRIEIHLRQLFSVAEDMNSMNATLIQSGDIDYRSTAEIQQHFLAEVKEFSFISSMYFGNTQGGLADAGKNVDGSYFIIETEDFREGDFVKYAADAEGVATSVITTLPDYDARTRSWYQDALAANGTIWSDVYLLFTGQDMAIAVSNPVYDQKGDLLGIVGSDLFLGDLTNFLTNNATSKDVQSLLLDRNGFLISASNYNALALNVETGEYERRRLEDISAPEIAAISNYLDNNEIDLSTLEEPQTFTVKTQKTRYYVNLHVFERLDGQDWLICVVVPETNFITSAIQQRQIVIIVFLVLAALMLGLSLYISSVGLKPLLTLNHKVQNFDINAPDDILIDTHFTEIHDFSLSFNALVQRLNAALHDLHQEIESHKESKARLMWSETLYRSIVEGTPGLLCRFLPNGEITFANKSYAEYYGLIPSEVVGKNFQDFLHEADRGSVMKEIRSLDKDKPSNSVTQRVYLPSGEVRHQRWVNRALFSDKGELIGYQAFGEDIQQEYQIQQAQSALYRIWRAANRAADLRDLYPVLREIIQEIIPTKNFIIALIDRENGYLFPAYYVDEYDALPPPRLDYQGPFAYVIEHQRTLHCTPEEFFELQPDLPREAIYGTMPKVWLGVPLILNSETIGVMAVQDYENADAFTPYAQEFLEKISPSVAGTIARRHAEAELNLYAQTNFVLLKASQTLSELLDLQQICQALYEFIIETMNCDFFMVSNYNPETEQITCDYLVQEGVVQDVGKFPPRLLDKTGGGIQSQVIIQKQARIIRDYLAEVEKSQNSDYIDDDGHFHDADDANLSQPITRSGLVVPILFQGEVSGVIQVMSFKQNTYTHNDLHILEALSSQISVVRNNAGLFKQVQLELDMRKQAEEKLKNLNLELEERVRERTKELNERISAVERLNTGMSNILHDLKLANERAEENSRELRGANDELEAFSYSVSHDLRAPIRHIESFSQLLHSALDNRLEENEERYFNNIFTATTKMRSLIQDLLTLSRANRTDLKLSQLDMNEIVRDVRDELLADTHGRDIKWTLGTLPPAQADSGLIRIVWNNLIGNAVKYTGLREKATIEIGSLSATEVNVELAESHQIFFIRDNGVGFDEAYSDKLFGVFQRLHQGTEFEGNGIGLATVRRIIARHGGTVWAKSKLEQGATFYFSLPKRFETDG